MTHSIAVLLAVAGFGAVLGGTVVWLVMAWRDLGPTKVREKPRMVELLWRSNLKSIAPAPDLGSGPAGRRPVEETEKGAAS